MFASQVDVHLTTYLSVEIPVVCFAFMCTVPKRIRTIDGYSHTSHKRKWRLSRGLKLFELLNSSNGNKNRNSFPDTSNVVPSFVGKNAIRVKVAPSTPRGGTACPEHDKPYS